MTSFEGVSKSNIPWQLSKGLKVTYINLTTKAADSLARLLVLILLPDLFEVNLVER